MANSRILYSYMHDPSDEKRVVTIGRQLLTDAEGKQVIKFAISVNNPGLKRFDRLTGEAFHIGLRDTFTKKKARMIVDGRLVTEGCNFTVDYDKEQHPMDTIRTYIALNRQEFTKAVIRTSEFYSEMRALDEKYLALMEKLEKSGTVVTSLDVDTLTGILMGNAGDKVVESH